MLYEPVKKVSAINSRAQSVLHHFSMPVNPSSPVAPDSMESNPELTMSLPSMVFFDESMHQTTILVPGTPEEEPDNKRTLTEAVEENKRLCVSPRPAPRFEVGIRTLYSHNEALMTGAVEITPLDSFQNKTHPILLIALLDESGSMQQVCLDYPDCRDYRLILLYRA